MSDASIWLPLAAGFAASALAAAGLTRLAARLGVGDAGAGREAWRKLQERSVPPIGGPAIMIGLLAVRAAGVLPFGGGGEDEAARLFGHAPELAVWAALGLAFATGLVDDLRRDGLGPRAKLLGQALAGLALAVPSWTAGQSPARALAASALAVAAACFATNVWNTFDNADGAASGLGGLGLLAAGSPGAGALLGFLPWNLFGPPLRGAQSPSNCASRAPFAYLGDSGSHLVGMLVLLTPAAWPVFFLPALDLARLVVVRLRRGRAPWRGDRRHLAHRLQGLGWSAPRVVLALAAIGLAPLVAGGFVGLVAGLAGFAVALTASPDPDRGPH